ncbi:hypothetical protein KI387_013978, partial [Taxus chinensis]
KAIDIGLASHARTNRAEDDDVSTQVEHNSVLHGGSQPDDAIGLQDGLATWGNAISGGGDFAPYEKNMAQHSY